MCGHVWIIFVSMATLKTCEAENSLEGLCSEILFPYSFCESGWWVMGLYLLMSAVAETWS